VRKGQEILPTFLNYDPDLKPARWVSLAEERKHSVQRTEVRIAEEIAVFFQNNPDTSFERDCMTAISGNTNEKWRVFKKMLVQGLLTKSGKGTKTSPFSYRLTGVATEGEAA
jgi:hypothetical protein